MKLKAFLMVFNVENKRLLLCLQMVGYWDVITKHSNNLRILMRFVKFQTFLYLGISC